MAHISVFSEQSLDMNTWKSVGKGGFGEVFKARHRTWKCDLAIKIIGLHAGEEGGADEAMREEVKAMRRAENPYVMRVQGYFRGSKPNTPFIHVGLVMDLMDRGTIDSLLKKIGQLPWPLVFQLAHQVALGMNYLHILKPSLIHRDLKPANVLLDPSLNIKITDFGLANFIGNATNKKNVGVGTPFFMAPESFSRAKKLHPFDVYSYAMLVFVILNGSRKIKFFNKGLGERPSLEAINQMQAPGLEELVQLMKRCWHQDPDSRPNFSECIPETEVLYGKHKSVIDDAVYEVLKKLDA